MAVLGKEWSHFVENQMELVTARTCLQERNTILMLLYLTVWKTLVEIFRELNAHIDTFQVLGYYNRRGINPEAFLSEIKYIASDPDDKHFFNVTDESALKDIVDALGERIFSLEGWARFFLT